MTDGHGWEIQAMTGSDAGVRFEITGIKFVDGYFQHTQFPFVVYLDSARESRRLPRA